MHSGVVAAIAVPLAATLACLAVAIMDVLTAQWYHYKPADLQQSTARSLDNVTPQTWSQESRFQVPGYGESALAPLAGGAPATTNIIVTNAPSAGSSWAAGGAADAEGGSRINGAASSAPGCACPRMPVLTC